VTVIYRERIPSTDPRLGRNIHFDDRSRQFPYRPRTRRLASIRHQRHTAILDQGSLGSCTGNAGIGCLGTGPFFATVSAADRYFHLDENDAIDLYSEATRIDPYPGAYPPDDTGSDGLTVAKVLTGYGQIAGYEWAFTLADALLALMDRPVITGINWYSDMFNPNPSGLIRPTGSLAGGHEIVVDEYDAARGWVGFSNSWGTGWGLNGRFYMTAEDWGTLLDRQGDVTVFVPATEPAPPAPVDPDLLADAAFALALHSWLPKWHLFPADRRLDKAARAWLAVRGL
jgi:hypothetical protein